MNLRSRPCFSRTQTTSNPFKSLIPSQYQLDSPNGSNGPGKGIFTCPDQNSYILPVCRRLQGQRLGSIPSVFICFLRASLVMPSIPAASTLLPLERMSASAISARFKFPSMALKLVSGGKEVNQRQSPIVSLIDLKGNDPDWSSLGENKRPFKDIPQFSDVSRPLITNKGLKSGWFDLGPLFDLHFVDQLVHDVFYEKRNVLCPLTQRRGQDGKHIQPVEKVAAKQAGLTCASRSRLVATMSLAFTLTTSSPPTRMKNRVSKKVRSLD